MRISDALRRSVGRALVPGLLVALVVAPPPAWATDGLFACKRSGNLGDLGLIPYFEVALADPGSSNTFFGIRRAVYLNHLTPMIFRVTLWTDFGVPTVSFDVVVTQTKEMALSFLLDSGALPNSAADRAAVAALPGCATFPPPSTLSPDLVASARKRHQGQSDVGRCHAKNYGDGRARGYITILPVDSCSPVTMGGAFSPALPPYAADNLVLQEFLVDYFLVDQESFVATSLSGVMLRYYVGLDSFFEKFGPPFDSFQMLPERWQTRFFSGLDFDGGTDLIVWRDSGNVVVDVACGEMPVGWPLDASFEATSESGATTISGTTFAFPVATQRVPIATLFGAGPSLSAGELFLDLFWAGGTFFPQGHVVSAMTATGRYGIALEATPAFFCE